MNRKTLSDFNRQPVFFQFKRGNLVAKWLSERILSRTIIAFSVKQSTIRPLLWYAFRDIYRQNWLFELLQVLSQSLWNWEIKTPFVHKAWFLFSIKGNCLIFQIIRISVNFDEFSMIYFESMEFLVENRKTNKFSPTDRFRWMRNYNCHTNFDHVRY